jgi:hypothetical protein
MSRNDYMKSGEIESFGYPFKAIIMAAMRQADDENLKKLKSAFYETWEELHRRYHSPGGYLPEDTAATVENAAGDQSADPFNAGPLQHDDSR